MVGTTTGTGSAAPKLENIILSTLQSGTEGTIRGDLKFPELQEEIVDGEVDEAIAAANIKLVQDYVNGLSPEEREASTLTKPKIETLISNTKLNVFKKLTLKDLIVDEHAFLEIDLDKLEELTLDNVILETGAFGGYSRKDPKTGEIKIIKYGLTAQNNKITNLVNNVYLDSDRTEGTQLTSIFEVNAEDRAEGPFAYAEEEEGQKGVDSRAPRRGRRHHVRHRPFNRHHRFHGRHRFRRHHGFWGSPWWLDESPTICVDALGNVLDTYSFDVSLGICVPLFRDLDGERNIGGKHGCVRIEIDYVEVLHLKLPSNQGSTIVPPLPLPIIPAAPVVAPTPAPAPEPVAPTPAPEPVATAPAPATTPATPANPQ